MSALDDLPPLREVIRRHDLSAKKSLGQNFLLDLNLTARIARAGGPLEGVTVVEIGPGPGGLTRALIASGARRVIAVERDSRAVAALEEIAAHYPGRLTVALGDALNVDLAACLDDGPARIVANLPYNIATALLVRWLATEPWPPWFDMMVLMFQREVAERIVAKPGEKPYGRLAVLTGWRAQAKIMFDVAPSAFVPPPKVTSSVVRLDPAGRAAAVPAIDARARHRRRLRPASQDAAPELTGPRRRSGAAPRRRGHRRRRARRRDTGRRIRRTRQRARRSLDAVAGWCRRRNARMTKLRRQSLVGYGAPLCETVVDCPQPQGSEVLVRIERCGVCHSDLHVQDGFFKLAADRKLDISAGRALPFTLGHEIAGVVEAAGPQADIAPGRKVAVYPWIGCGECPACRHGDENLCTEAATSRHRGGRRLCEPRRRPPSALSPRLRAAVAVARGRADVLGAHRLCRAQAARRPRRARTVLLVGLGGVGMMGLALARAMYETAPIVADIDAGKRNAALAAGAAAAFDPADPGARKAVLAATGGVYGVCDFVGSEASLGFAVGALAKGGKVVVTGLLGGGFSTAVAMFPLRAMTIEGTLTGTLDEAGRASGTRARRRHRARSR